MKPYLNVVNITKEAIQHFILIKIHSIIIVREDV